MSKKKKIANIAAQAKSRSPKRNMHDLLSVLDSTIVPDPDKYYTFVYKAKTKGIIYDAHPVVKVGAVYSWGFVGFNLHWGGARQYTWQEVISNLYIIPEDLVELVLATRTFKRKKS